MAMTPSPQPNRCEAVCVMKDYRFGGIPNQCDRGNGHDGDHIARLDATEPMAELVWKDEPR